MAVRPRGNNWQADFAYRSVRYRQDFATKLEAQQWEAETKAELLKGRKVAGPKGGPAVLFSKALQATYDRCWKGQKDSEKSLKNGETVSLILGEIQVKAIDGEMIDTVVAEMESRKYAPSTINRKLAALSKVLRHSHKRGWIKALPPIERKREPTGRMRFYTKEEETVIIGWLNNSAYESVADLVTFLIDSGLRLSEALNLRNRHVTGGLTMVRDTKTPAGDRTVPQTGRLKVLVARRLLAQPKDSDCLFWDLTKRIADRGWTECREALKQESDPDWVMHTLRHTFISRLVQNGTHLRTVQVLAGHASLAMTQRYAHLAAHNYMDAIAGLEAGTKHPIHPQIEASLSHAGNLPQMAL